jgi:hypothetical protein
MRIACCKADRASEQQVQAASVNTIQLKQQAAIKGMPWYLSKTSGCVACCF